MTSTLALVSTVLFLAQTPATAPVSGRQSAQASVTAIVQSIDYNTREVTVKGSLGNVVTFTVDKSVARLNEIKVGDEVMAEYYVSIAGEARPATETEKLNPIQILKETAKAPAGTDPAGGALRVIRVVCTVEGLDRPTKTLTVAGPKGNLVSVQVADVGTLSKLRLGETLIVTYTEALAVALTKRAPK